jgi:hypothetical protein
MNNPRLLAFTWWLILSSALFAPVSLMPEGLLQSLSPTQVSDRMTFALNERPPVPSK